MKKSMAILMAVIVGATTALAMFYIMSYHFQLQMDGDKDSLSLNEFATVEGIIDKYYLNDYDMKDVQYAGLKAMVASLGDPYSVYYTPEEFAAFNQATNGEYSGIGMQISMDETVGLAVVEMFFEGSPAKEAGIEIGDYIISIDGEDVAEKSLEEISILCIGEEGTSITMGVLRGTERLEFQMVRRTITRDMLSYEMLDDEIGYMKIVQFSGNSAELFSKAMDAFVQQNAQGVVIDLRDNPGGFFNVVVEMLDKLLPEGTLVYTEDRYGNKEISESDANMIDIPITLIVNGNTASASEIFAGAVQDFDYGDVVGTTTYGKGVVQMVETIPSTGGGIKITISEYFTPKGRSINGNGIYPDYFVELSEDFYENPDRENDTQLLKAIEVLQQRIKQQAP